MGDSQTTLMSRIIPVTRNPFESENVRDPQNEKVCPVGQQGKKCMVLQSSGGSFGSDNIFTGMRALTAWDTRMSQFLVVTSCLRGSSTLSLPL